MAITRSMTRTVRQNAPGGKKSKTSNDGGSPPWSWSDLIKDVLILILMKLGVGDFYSFSWVCKSWRSCALSNRAKFMKCQPPMLISSVKTRTSMKYYLVDYKRKKFKTMLPNCNNRICCGVSCSYLIMYSSKTNDLLLVNPITRCKLYFPDVPIRDNSMNLESINTILVYSRSMSTWMLLLSPKCCNIILYSISGQQTGWKALYSNYIIKDLCAFKGKLYVLHERNQLSEMSFNPEPTLTQLEMKNVFKFYYLRTQFVSSDDNLYVLIWTPGKVYEALELDFDKMEWVPATKTIAKYALFFSYFAGGVAINPEKWDGRGTRYETCLYVPNINDSLIGRCNIGDMWYFPHECLNENVEDDDSV